MAGSAKKRKPGEKPYMKRKTVAKSTPKKKKTVSKKYT